MSTEYDSIALYKIHKKECEQHILMDMTKIFDVEDMLYASIWKVYCQAIDNNIPNEKRRDYVYNIIDKELNKFI